MINKVICQMCRILMALGFESCHKTLVGVSIEILKDYLVPYKSYIYKCSKKKYMKNICIKDGKRYENFKVKISNEINN